MMNVGAMLAQQIDRYSSKNVPKYQKDHLNQIITQGKGHIGRILHYFPYDTKG